MGNGGMRNGWNGWNMEWNTEWSGIWNGESWEFETLKKDDKSMLQYSVDIASGLLIPDVTQNSPKKRISAYSPEWTDLINNCIDIFSCKQVSSKHDATDTHDK